MIYSEISPSFRLAPFIETFWTLESDRSHTIQEPERILPDGCLEIIFNLADPFKRSRPDNSLELQPLHLIAGQMTSPVMVQPMGRVRLFGVRFRPSGARVFFRFPLNELTGQVVGAREVLGRLSGELEERICLAGSMDQRISIIESVMMDRLRHDNGFDSLVSAVVGKILRTDGRLPLDQLLSNVGISSRQLERRFQGAVGIGPKLLSRIIRFQRVFRAVEQGSGWGTVAYDCGYYDQAHLIRDFRQFAGQNPSAYFLSQYEMSLYFIRKDRMSDFSNTPA